MGTIKDVYDILKDLRSLAKEANNQPMIELAVDIQDKLFDIKDDMQKLKEENMSLQKEIKFAGEKIKDLEKQLVDYENIKSKLSIIERGDDTLAFYNQEVTLYFTEIHHIFTSSTVFHKKTLTFTLDEIFKAISLKMMTQVKEWQFVEAFTSLCMGYQVDEKQALQIKAQFLALGLIEISTNKKDEEVIKLTQKGLKEMQKLNTIKQGENK